MSVRLFIENDLRQDAQVALSREQSHYLANVMRRIVGDTVSLFNGRDGEWTATISALEKRNVHLCVDEQTREQHAEPDLWLVFAPIKKARLDFIAQKAAELGVSNLTPVITRRTIVDRVNTDRMKANAIEAAEQCERLTVPDIGETVKLEQCLANWPEGRRIMFCDEELSGEPAHAALQAACDKSTAGEWAILVGPEGGFDDRERELIKAKPDCVTVSLGPRVLRADTAAMTAISIWQSALGDW